MAYNTAQNSSNNLNIHCSTSTLCPIKTSTSSIPLPPLSQLCVILHYTGTVKPLMFACPLFREIRDLNKNRKI